MPRLQRVAIATVCCAAIGPSSAFAQEEDAVVDRDSPAGREYVIPLEGARRDAAPATGKSDRSTVLGDRSAPVFGAGITPRPGANSGSGSGSSGSGSGPGSSSELPFGSKGDSDNGRSSGDASRGDSDSNDRDDTDFGSALGQRGEGGGSASPLGSSQEARLTDESALSSPWVIGIAAAVLLFGVWAGILGRKLRRPST